MDRNFLLVSDVDNTLLGDDDATAAFAEWFHKRRDHLRLALSSGRFFKSVLDSVHSSPLPMPDAFIGGVGTEIRLPPHGEPLDDWPPAAKNWDPATIRAALFGFDGLEPQPKHLQSQHKISFYGYELEESHLTSMLRRLKEAGQRADIVYSSRRDLDVLPAGVNKGTAIVRLARHWQIDPSHVIVAGDSGNDLAMFRQDYRGIVVANAHPELKTLTGSHVYHASQPCAAGVLEGLRHWLND